MTLVASTGRQKYANAMANRNGNNNSNNNNDNNNNNKCMKQASEEQNSD